MKRLGTLALAVILVTGCNAMKPNMEETERLSQWAAERYTAQAMAIQQRGTWREMLADTQPDEPEIAKTVIPVSAPAAEQAKASRHEPETPGAPTGAAFEPQEASMPEPEKTAQENHCQSEQAKLRQEESVESLGWPLIICPPEPTPALTGQTPIPRIDWPYPQIICPPKPASTPEPEPTEQLQEEPTVPVPEATEQPTEPDPMPAQTPPFMPEPTPTATSGYAACSCGATLTPEELVSHMKAHAMSGESHSYRAY